MRTILFALLAGVQLLSSPALAEPHSISPLKIGFVLPLSGEWAFLGNGIRDIDHAKVVQSFRQLASFPGVTGLLKVRPDGIIWSDASIKVIKNGKAEILPP